MDKAEREHAKRAADIQAEVEALEQRARTEDGRWEKERERLGCAPAGTGVGWEGRINHCDFRRKKFAAGS